MYHIIAFSSYTFRKKNIVSLRASDLFKAYIRIWVSISRAPRDPI